jgi:hypothetical protein
MIKSRLPQLIKIVDEGHVPSNLILLARALVGCELHPDHGICIPRKKPTWLVFGVRVDDLKKRYPEIFRRFREKIRTFYGEILDFGGSQCEPINCNPTLGGKNAQTKGRKKI